ncbi:MAG: hypothetical protein NXI20_02245 [bacterium]|nr:hypothetical protein [bacterium]
MKRTILILFGILSAFACFSQRPKTLIGNNLESISGFGGPMFQFTMIDGKAAVLTGGGGAVIMNNQIYVGGYGLGTVTTLNKTLDNVDYATSFEHGGLMFGYIIKPQEIFHIAIGTKLGWGEINTWNKEDAGLYDEADNIFVFNPTLEGEINVTQWFKLNAGVGFNSVVGVSNDLLYKPIDFNKPQVSLSLFFGWFY